METIQIEGEEAQHSALDLHAPEEVEPLPAAEAPAKRKRPSRKKASAVSEEIAVAAANPEAGTEMDPSPEEAVAHPKKAPAKPTGRTAKSTAAKAPEPAAEVSAEPVSEVPAAEVTPEVETEASKETTSEAASAPRKSGWWSRNAQKLFGN